MQEMNGRIKGIEENIGTFVYHDLGMPFLSPIINLTIGMDDFDYVSFLNSAIKELS